MNLDDLAWRLAATTAGACIMTMFVALTIKGVILLFR